MKKLWIIVAMVALFALVGTSAVMARDFHFILVNNRTTLTNFNPDYDGAQLACDEMKAWTGDKVTWEIVGPTEMNLVAEAQAMEAAIAKRPDGFMVICWDAKTMTPPINKAMDAGIPVVTIDADAPDSKRISYIGTDWYSLGVDLGNALAKEINYKGKVAMLGLVGADNMETAFSGFTATVAKWPDIKIVAKEHDNSNKAESARIATALMQKYPDLAGLAGFDSESGPGIARAVKEAGQGREGEGRRERSERRPDPVPEGRDRAVRARPEEGLLRLLGCDDPLPPPEEQPEVHRQRQDHRRGQHPAEGRHRVPAGNQRRRGRIQESVR